MVDFSKFLKQAQSMQQKIQEVQEKIAVTEFTGKSGGGMVNITMTGKGEMRQITLDPSLLKLEEKEVLEDLIIAAFNDAKKKSDEASEQSMSNSLGSTMQLPPGFKMPF